MINLPMVVITCNPAVNGTNDLAFKKLNMSIRPEDQLINDPIIKIIWSSTFDPRPQKCGLRVILFQLCPRPVHVPQLFLVRKLTSASCFRRRICQRPSTRNRSQRRESRKQGLNHRHRFPFIHCHPLLSDCAIVT